MLEKLRRKLLPSMPFAVQPSRVVRWLYRKTFSAKDRIRFYDLLAFQLDNNKTLQQAFMDMRDVATDFGSKEHPYAVLLTDFLNALEEGQHAFETVLLDWVPVQEATLISAGFLAGDISSALKRATVLVEAKDAMTAALSGALIYPGFLLSLVILVMNLIVRELIPQLVRLVPREHWGGALKYMTGISEFVVNNGPLLIVVALLVIGLVYWSLGNWASRRWADRLLPWSVFRAIQGVNFLLIIASLLRVNIKVLDAVGLIRETANPWLERRLAETMRYMNKGQHLGLALKSAGYHFPSKDCVNEMLLLTENAGTESVLEKYADRWLTETVKSVKRLAVQLFAGCMVLFFAYLLLLLMTIQDLNQLVNQL